MGKFTSGVVGAAKSLKPSEVKKNPAAAVGTVVGAGVAAAGHPYLAPVAAAGAEKLANRAIPAIRSRVNEFTTGRGITPGSS